MILLASTCISQIFETLVRVCKCAYRFEYNPARNPSDRYVQDVQGVGVITSLIGTGATSSSGAVNFIAT